MAKTNKTQPDNLKNTSQKNGSNENQQNSSSRHNHNHTRTAQEESMQSDVYMKQHIENNNKTNPYARTSETRNSVSDTYRQVRTGVGEEEYEYQKKMHQQAVMRQAESGSDNKRNPYFNKTEDHEKKPTEQSKRSEKGNLEKNASGGRIRTSVKKGSDLKTSDSRHIQKQEDHKFKNTSHPNNQKTENRVRGKSIYHQKPDQSYDGRKQPASDTIYEDKSEPGQSYSQKIHTFETTEHPDDTGIRTVEESQHDNSDGIRVESGNQNHTSDMQQSHDVGGDKKIQVSSQTQDLKKNGSWSSITGEQAAQMEWMEKMQGRTVDESFSQPDDVFSNIMKAQHSDPDPTHVHERMPHGMKFSSEDDRKTNQMRVHEEANPSSGIRTVSENVQEKSKNIRSDSDTPSISDKNIRTAGNGNEAQQEGYAISTVVAGGANFKTSKITRDKRRTETYDRENDISRKQNQGVIDLQKNPSYPPYPSVYMGTKRYENGKGYNPGSVGLYYFSGKTSDGKYHSLGTHAAATNYKSVYSNEELAKKCGIYEDPELGNLLRKIYAEAGEKGELYVSPAELRQKIQEAGYTLDYAAKYAPKNLYEPVFGTGSSEQGSGTQEQSELICGSVLKGLSETPGEPEKLKATIENNKIVIYKPIGLTKTDWAIRVERPMNRVSTMSYYYAQGVAGQQGEAGQGLSNVVQGMRIASIVLPQTSVHVKHQLEHDLQEHLNDFVVFNLHGKKMQWTVEETKDFLEKAGIQRKLFEDCEIGSDFSLFAGAMLKKDAETDENSKYKLTEEQKGILTDLKNARSAKAYERTQINNAVLRKYGVILNGDYGHSAVSRVKAEWNKAVQMYGGEENLPEDLKAALKENIQQAKQQTYSNVSGKMKMAKIAMIAKGTAEKNGAEAGRGISVVTRTAQLTKMTVKGYITLVWSGNMLAREAAQKAVLLAAKGMLASAKAANAAGFAGAAKRLAQIGTKSRKASNMFRNANRKVNRGVRNAPQNTKNWIRDHNPARKLADKAKTSLKKAGKQAFERFKDIPLINKISNSKFGKAFGKGIGKIKDIGSKIASGFANMFRAIGYIKHLIKRVLLLAAAGLLLIVVFALVINTIGAAVGAIFNVDSQEYDTKMYLSQQLKQYWEDDMQYAFDIQDQLTDSSYDPNTNPNVDHATIKFVFEDYKHYAKKDVKQSYEKGDLACGKEENETHTHTDECYDTNIWNLNYRDVAKDYESFDYLQSSNNGEILSMALIKYNFDFGRLKDRWFSSEPKPNKQLKEVSDYVKKLYYGSHNLVVQVSGQTHSSDDVSDTENPESEDSYNYTEYIITVTYKTYYFNYLFDCALSDTPQRTKNSPDMSSIGGFVCSADSWEGIYVAIREAGYPHNAAAAIMSNLAHESGDHSASMWHNAVPNPTAGPPYGKGAYGICQWTSSGDRKQRLLDWCTANNQDSATITGQLAYMFHELDTGYTGVRDFLKGNNSAYDCGHKFGDDFEVYHVGSDPIQETRGTLATVIAEYYDKYKDDWSELKGNGDEIAKTAYEFLGCAHYTWGDGMEHNGKVYVGARLSIFTKEQLIEGMKNRTCGVDCSSFCHGIYALCGINNNANGSYDYPKLYGAYYPLEQAEPGDVAWRDGHVGICVGGGNVVAASSCHYPNCSEDIKIQKLSGFTGVYKVKQISGS